MSGVSKHSSPGFRDLHASFERRDKHVKAIPPSASLYRIGIGFADMSAGQTSSDRNLALTKTSIDSLVGGPTPPGPSPSVPVRPSTSSRPSWIGPLKTPADSASKRPAMKQKVGIEFTSAGLKPPVYVFTSLSTPEWEAVEMRSKKQEDGEYLFMSNFDAEPGVYQYKFRLGPGDWWACDSNKPIVDDGMGNRNNQISVLADTAPTQTTDVAPREEQKGVPKDSQISHFSSTSQQLQGLPVSSKSDAPSSYLSSMQASAAAKGGLEHDPPPTPPLPHETHQSVDTSAQAQRTPDAAQQDTYSGNELAVDTDYQAPLLRHETAVADSVLKEQTTREHERTSESDSVSDSDSASSSDGPERHIIPPDHPNFDHERPSPRSQQRQHAARDQHKKPETSSLDREYEKDGLLPSSRPEGFSGHIPGVADEADASVYSRMTPRSSSSPPFIRPLPHVQESEVEEEDVEIIQVEVEEEQNDVEEDGLAQHAAKDQSDAEILTVTPLLSSKDTEDADFGTDSLPKHLIQVDETIEVEVSDKEQSSSEFATLVGAWSGGFAVTIAVVGVMVGAMSYFMMRSA